MPVFATLSLGPGPLTITSPQAQDNGNFGVEDSLSGSTLAVGAPGEMVSGYADAGHVYLFDAKTGASRATLASPNMQEYGAFGDAVAIRGSVLVVGAPEETDTGHTDSGNAYVFNATTGALIRTLTSPNVQTYGFFGDSVAISGSMVAIGADGETVSGFTDAGHVYVYNPTTGTLLQTLAGPKPDSEAYFGGSVAIGGTTVVVGDSYATASGHGDAGLAYVFDGLTGKLLHTLSSPTVQTDAEFGSSVAIGGALVIVGAPDETTSEYGLYAGEVYVFDTTTGALKESVTSPNAQDRGYFGGSVEISGSIALIGALGETVKGIGGAGHAYLYNTTSGEIVATLVSPHPQSNGYFGERLAILGSTKAIGAPGELVTGHGGAGHVYVYRPT